MLEKTNSRIFTFLIGLSALAVATAAAIFSVIGLSMLYSGEMLYVAIAMGTLEFSKIITASYLYRYWKATGFGLKTYLTIALFVLMLVTSGGIYGYLTHSYQGATIGLDKINSQSLILEQRKENVIAERERLVSDIVILRSERQSTVENRNNEIAANNMAVDSNSVKYRAWRNSQVHKRYNVELTNIDNSVAKYTIDLDSTNVRLSRLNDKISDKKLEMIDTGADVGPLVYMARIFNTTMDTVMKWFTLVIVFVFDPLAIALIIALNVVLAKSKKETQYDIGVDVAKPGDHSAIFVAEEKEDGTFDLGEPDDLSFVNAKEKIDDYFENTSEEKIKEDFENAKPVEQAFDDIKKKLDERKNEYDKEKEFLQEIDDEISIGVQQELFDQGDEVKTRYAEKIVKPEMEYPPGIEVRPDRKAIWLDDKDKKKNKRIAHVNEFFDKMRVEKPNNHVYTKKRSPVTDNEIREFFEDAVRKVKKEGQGKITRTPFQPGGSVSVGHMEDDPDRDYSIQ